MKDENNEFQELISAYLDGELTASQAEKVERRLAEDAQARALLDDMKKVSALLGSLPREKAPEYLLEEVQQEIERSVLLSKRSTMTESAGRNHLLIRKVAAVAAMVMLLGAIGTIIYSVLGKEGGSTESAIPYTVPQGASDRSMNAKELFHSAVESARDGKEALPSAESPLQTAAAEKRGAAPGAEISREAEPAKTASETDMAVAGEYGAVQLVLLTQNMTSSLERVEEILSSLNLLSVVRKDTEGQRQYAFLCSADQLGQIYPELSQGGIGSLVLWVPSEGGNDVEVPEADLRQVLLVAHARGAEAKRQLVMDFSRNRNAKTAGLSETMHEEPVEEWLNQMIAQAKPEIKELRSLGGVAGEIPCDSCPKASKPLTVEDNMWSANVVSTAKENKKEMAGEEASDRLTESSESEMIAVVLIVK